jgi:AraC family transcriptional regulator of adaptative response/methylated-DNA-[protein]-cysteine methyltransferase
LALLSEQASVTPFHLQRVFKKILGITPREYADACRIRALKQKLRAGQSVTHALFDAGYGSTSRLYERSDLRLGMTPATYGRKGRGARIRYALADSALGKVLVAATAKGICSLQFGNSARALTADLMREFAEAELIRDQEGLAQWLISIVRSLEGLETHLALPLEVRATAFQAGVWKHLQTIPPGTTQSYAEVAMALGRPTAARAVARACASNPVAVAIPCHRVIRQDGGLGGYRWGLKRKERLLAQERQERSKP